MINCDSNFHEHPQLQLFKHIKEEKVSFHETYSNHCNKTREYLNQIKFDLHHEIDTFFIKLQDKLQNLEDEEYENIVKTFKSFNLKEIEANLENKVDNWDTNLNKINNEIKKIKDNSIKLNFQNDLIKVLLGKLNEFITISYDHQSIKVIENGTDKHNHFTCYLCQKEYFADSHQICGFCHEEKIIQCSQKLKEYEDIQQQICQQKLDQNQIKECHDSKDRIQPPQCVEYKNVHTPQKTNEKKENIKDNQQEQKNQSVQKNKLISQNISQVSSKQKSKIFQKNEFQTKIISSQHIEQRLSQMDIKKLVQEPNIKDQNVQSFKESQQIIKNQTPSKSQAQSRQSEIHGLRPQGDQSWIKQRIKEFKQIDQEIDEPDFLSNFQSQKSLKESQHKIEENQENKIQEIQMQKINQIQQKQQIEVQDQKIEQKNQYLSQEQKIENLEMKQSQELQQISLKKSGDNQQLSQQFMEQNEIDDNDDAQKKQLMKSLEQINQISKISCDKQSPQLNGYDSMQSIQNQINQNKSPKSHEAFKLDDESNSKNEQKQKNSQQIQEDHQNKQYQEDIIKKEQNMNEVFEHIEKQTSSKHPKLFNTHQPHHQSPQKHQTHSLKNSELNHQIQVKSHQNEEIIKEKEEQSQHIQEKQPTSGEHQLKQNNDQQDIQNDDQVIQQKEDNIEQEIQEPEKQQAQIKEPIPMSNIQLQVIDMNEQSIKDKNKQKGHHQSDFSNKQKFTPNHIPSGSQVQQRFLNDAMTDEEFEKFLKSTAFQK